MLPPDAQMPQPPEPGAPLFGLRCGICNIDWPPIPELFDHNQHTFVRDLQRAQLECPQCKGTVSPAGNLQPIDFTEAWSLKMHADFERFYEARGPRDVLTEEDLAQYGVD